MIKYFLFGFLFFSVVISAQSVVPSQSINQPVQSATLYLDGAELVHSKTVTLNVGRTNLIFVGLTSKLIGKSVQVIISSQEVNLLAVSDKINYFNSAKESARIKSLKDSLKLVTREITLLQNEREAYEKEKEMLMRNTSIGGQNTGVSIAELKLAADFYRYRVKEINTALVNYLNKIDDKSELVQKLEFTMSELNVNKFNPTSEVTVLVSTPVKITTTIELHYITTAGGWTPTYDLKADDINKPITLIYRAKVYNNCGIDWDNIKLKLSTGDPMKNAAKPSVETWFVNYNEEQANYYNKSKSKGYYSNTYSQDEYKSEMSKNNTSAPSVYLQMDKKSEENATQITYEEIQVSDLSAEFDIKEPYTVPCDAKPYIVDVTTYNLSASFRHYALPKVEREAFMLARITGWEELDLVEGPCNVYFGGSFVGTSYIDTKSIDDTLDLSLGRDKKIQVTRSQIKDLTKEKIIGNSRKITYSYEMMIKNNRKTAVTIDVEDQLPITKNTDITVDPINTSSGGYNKDNGRLTWTFTLQPDEFKKVTLTFSIKYPRDRAVNVKSYRKKSRAKF